MDGHDEPDPGGADPGPGPADGLPALDPGRIRIPDDPGPLIDGVPLPPPARTGPRHGGSILMAAMIGIAEALGFDPEPTEVAQPADPGSGPELDIDFGDLPPLA